ncbi:MAG TPA: hypothetical protein VGP93_08155 [Polyangiaceae bacterium]|nr:hypothetical protein [Polyangiaceae bacterium]
MPEHSNFLTFFLAYLKDTLERNASVFGESIVGHHAPTWESFEPLASSLLVLALVLGS